MSYTDPAAPDPSQDKTSFVPHEVRLTQGRTYAAPVVLALGATALVVAGVMFAVLHRKPTSVTNVTTTESPSASPHSSNSEVALGVSRAVATGWTRSQLTANGKQYVFFYMSPLTESSATVLVNEAVASESWSELPQGLVVAERYDNTNEEAAKTPIAYAKLIITDIPKATEEIPKDLQIVKGETSTALIQPVLDGARVGDLVIQSTFPNQVHRIHLAASTTFSPDAPVVKLLQSL